VKSIAVQVGTALMGLDAFSCWRRVFAFLLIAVWQFPVSMCAAQESVVLANGKSEYENHCATCHGVSATGNGAMAAFLTLKPADLTQISQKNGGEFPFWRIFRVIDGREDVMAHGSRRMPVWGSEFLLEEGGQEANEDRVLGRILALVYYLQSIQEQSYRATGPQEP
jgi:mono/diheme cytochrome c family protein